MTQRKREDRGFGIPSLGTAARSGLSVVAGLLISSAALADWNAAPETIATHPTWIYEPGTTLKDSGKRGLMIVLHGCAQTHDQIKKGGNLEKSADKFGLVTAVPFVTQADGYLLGCWNYDGGINDNNGHVAEITAIAKELAGRDDLGIDAAHVYVVGLSSGGALALKLGCTAPDVFAGVGAIAGPSVGSSQMMATTDGSGIPATNVDNAIATCKQLAGSKWNFLQRQITNIAHGDMDKNGPKQIVETPACQQKHPGQNCVASIKWSEDNVKVLRNIYGTGAMGPAEAIQGGLATERTAKAGDEVVLSYVVLHGVGHAYPAGSGRPNDDSNGQYIAQEGANYTEYVSEWFVENNRIDDVPQVQCVTAKNSEHVAESRAEACGLFGMRACAKGSGDDLGFNFDLSYFSSSVKSTGPGYWAKAASC